MLLKLSYLFCGAKIINNKFHGMWYSEGHLSRFWISSTLRRATESVWGLINPSSSVWPLRRLCNQYSTGEVPAVIFASVSKTQHQTLIDLHIEKECLPQGSMANHSWDAWTNFSGRWHWHPQNLGVLSCLAKQMILHWAGIVKWWLLYINEM